MTRRFAAVIFDMDGVLVDSEPKHMEAIRAVLAPHGVEYTDADNDRFFGFTDMEVFTTLSTERGLPLDASGMTRRRVEMIVEFTRAQSIPPMDGVPAVIHQLHDAGYRLAVASGSAMEIIEATLDVLGITACFDVVVSCLTIGRGKPAPDVFLAAAERLGVPPSRCLVVEDSRNGLLAAKAAGMACAAIPCAETSRQDFSEADWRFERFSEVLPLLVS